MPYRLYTATDSPVRFAILPTKPNANPADLGEASRRAGPVSPGQMQVQRASQVSLGKCPGKVTLNQNSLSQNGDGYMDG